MTRCLEKVLEYPRALVVGDASDKEVWAVNLGKLSKYREMQVDVLRAATALETNTPHRERKKKLLQCWEVLRRRYAKTFGEMVPTRIATASDPRTVTDMPMYCESSRVSLQNPGRLYEAVQMPPGGQVPGFVATNILFGFVASFLNTDEMQPEKHQEAAHSLLAHCRDTYKAYLESDQ